MKIPRLHRRWQRLTAVCMGLGLLVGIVFVAALVYVPLPMDKTALPEAYRYYDRNGDLLQLIISEDGFYRIGTSTEDLPPHFEEILLFHEDRYFYRHFGVNPLAIGRAAFSNLKEGRIVSGGSTISMQLARMLERRDRTIWAKMIEAFRAMQLELRYDKSEILSFYLSLAPYGGNLEGLEAASYFYFGKPATSLSIAESALLAGLPQAPNRFRPDRHPERAKAMRDRLLSRLHENQLISDDEFRRARAEPVSGGRRSPIRLIPHTAWSLRYDNPQQYDVRTYIDRNIQSQAQRILSNYVQTLDDQGISNAAAVIIDNETSQIVASIGSSDYYDQERLGANDGTRLRRSPGSTLKPFVYGLALQDGIISEKTILDDIPVNYSGYSPNNYSENFRGPVTAREALVDSLNIPAVRLGQTIGLDAIHQLLEDGGVGDLDPDPGHYGLPIVLGGVEISLLDLTDLYASLANNGVYRQALLHPGQGPRPSPRRLLSPEATWLISDMLTSVERPDFPASWQFSSGRPTVAWKTGTSYGHQDAWSVGYTPSYTVGVWIGNFDRRPASGLAGSTAAAPLLFNLMQILHTPHDNGWFQRPEGVQRRQVCATCGRLPNRHCSHMTTEYYIEDVKGPSLSAICQVPQRIVVDSLTGEPATGETPLNRRESQVWDVWPSQMASFLVRHGVGIEDAPPYDPNNMAGEVYYPPRILSPVANTIYYKRLAELSNEDHGIRLSGAVTNRIREVTWFLDGEIIHQGSPWSDIIINPPPGDYDLKLVDDVGGEAKVRLRVRDYRELAQHESE